MEELQIPKETRLKWIALLQELFESLPEKMERSSILFSRALEQYAHSHIRETIPIGEDVNVLRYGNVDVLDLDSDATHMFHGISNYNAMLSRIACAIANGNLKEIKAMKEVTHWFSIHEEKITEDTDHSKWEKKFFAQQELSRSILLGRNATPSTGIFQCKRCNSYDIDTEQKQTRSSDEPMTIFCTCNSCGKRFVI